MKIQYFKGSGIIVGAKQPTDKYSWLTIMPCTDKEADINVGKLTVVDNKSYSEIQNLKDDLVVGQFEYCYKKIQICANLITNKNTDFLITTDNRNGYLVAISRYGYMVVRGHNYVES